MIRSLGENGSLSFRYQKRGGLCERGKAWLLGIDGASRHEMA